ncbi:TIGR04372 family glycosyltransferase [Methylomonas sp. YC3]
MIRRFLAINKNTLTKPIKRLVFYMLLKLAETDPVGDSFKLNIDNLFRNAALPVLRLTGKLFFVRKKYQSLLLGIMHFAEGQEQQCIDNFKASALLGLSGVDIVLNHLARVQFSKHNYIFTHELLGLAHALEPKNADASYNLALTNLIFGDIDVAVELIMNAIKLDVKYAMPHQNLAARYDREGWKPTALDLTGINDLHLYDACHYLGQLLVNHGNSKKGLEIFGIAMAAQDRLSKEIKLPIDLVDKLKEIQQFDPDKPIRIMPYEWVTQIGHIGMIDALLKMQRLGIRPDCNWILLAPRSKVANYDFLKCFDRYLVIIEDIDFINALFPYQRICGEQFNCYINEQGQSIDWSDAAARAFIEWDQRELGPLISADPLVVKRGRDKLHALGVPQNTWFAVLHVRSSGFYGEGFGFIQSHRNSPLNSYIPAIQRIHKEGGWVIRIGDPSMPKLESMPMTIDLAHSPYRSREFDVYLWSHARFFLGTTSGPTNAVISFNTPTLLVNCVSNYAQSWNNRVLFVLKPFWSKHEGRLLKMREAFTPEMRSKMFNIDSMNAGGFYPVSNSAEDILDATEEVLDFLNRDGLPKMRDSDLLAGAGCEPWLWGNAHPCATYFKKNKANLID